MAPSELLTPDEMGEADRLAALRGPFDGYGLMLNAGRAVAREILARFADVADLYVLCGPGNNGGDGYVVAEELRIAGMRAKVHALAEVAPGTDAGRARAGYGGEVLRLGDFAPEPGALVVDALFGAGLRREIEGEALGAILRMRERRCRVVAIDLPSGVAGAGGRVLGDAPEAELTVTFFRRKIGHLLYPGRRHCGETVVVDIGIPGSVLDEIAPRCFENGPGLWADRLPPLDPETHKYARGAVGVFSGGPHSTGAARLAAMAAQRAGAGAVTVLSPSGAMQVNACHLTSIMLKRIDGVDDVVACLRDGRRRAYVLGPGFGVGEPVREFAFALMAGDHDGLVLDADAITGLSADPQAFLGRDRSREPALVLTPHEGEFGRLFAPIAGDRALSKLDRARRAAAESGAILVCKGPDTVIAAPDGRAAINSNATPALATAGSGDVLAGIVAGLMARRMPAFEAACAAVWIHAEAGRIAGNHCIAEDLPACLPGIFASFPGR